jgi:Holliday junction resolvasome RuvABC ATP-dependent DNA helicase subunit
MQEVEVRQASVLGVLPSRTIADVSEPFLLRAGLVMKDDNGRWHVTKGHVGY